MINVTLPDGSTIEVPSTTREMKSREIGSDRSVFVEEPAPHDDYRFTPVVGGWLARPRSRPGGEPE